MNQEKIEKDLNNLLLEIENAKNPKLKVIQYRIKIKNYLKEGHKISQEYTEKNRELTNKYMIKLK